MLRIVRLIFALIIFFSVLPVPRVNSQAAFEPLVVITEIRVSGDPINVEGVGPVGDFISVFNKSTANVDLTGWWLEYASSSDATSCGIWNVPDDQIVELSGIMPFDTLSLPIGLEMPGNQSGSIRLIDKEGWVHDVVGWGSTAPCSEDSPAERPTGGNSIKRYLNCSGSAPLDTNNNLADFMAPSPPSPGVLNEVTPDNCEDTSDVTDDIPPEETSDCDGAVVNEILPNPEGSDSGNEFIELYNPTNRQINLKNCQLQTSSSSGLFIFEDKLLGPGKYLALYDSETGLGLANSAGGTVWLLNHNDDELQEISYQEDLDDNVAWARFESGWRQTYKPTPGKENVLQATKPCPTGQYRSTETNRCRSSILASTLLKPCAPGKERNPLTNRCRSSTSALSSLKPCDSDQYRNPETNRCKKVNSGTALKPCKPNQERNPLTNRCRKVGEAAGENTLTDVKDVAAPNLSQNVSWMFAGASMIGAVGYAAFEWRKEFLSVLSNIKSKFTISSD